MATVESTPSVKNYLGHPCALAPAFARFEESLDSSRKQYKDPRHLVQNLGRFLAEVSERVEHAHDVAELAQERAQGNSGDDHLNSLLAMQADHMLGTCNRLFEFAGMVLDALDRADMVKPSQAKEAAHG